MPDLSPGDRLTIGVTHTIEIDREKSWIKTEVNAVIRDGETAQEAYDRIGAVVADQIVAEIERQAAPVAAANAAQR